MSKKITTILTKIVEQLRNNVSKKEITKLNDYHDANVGKTVDMVNSEHKLLLINTMRNYCIACKHDEWVKDIMISEFNKIARVGKGTIRFNINTKEYEILKSWLKENIDE